MEGIKNGITEIINKPYDDKKNFDLAYSYENEGQYAAAISFYLRCAEFSANQILISESLIRASLCINKQVLRTLKLKDVSELMKTRLNFYLLSVVKIKIKKNL